MDLYVVLVLRLKNDRIGIRGIGRSDLCGRPVLSSYRTISSIIPHMNGLLLDSVDDFPQDHSA
jgi:hypothetical protein